MKQLLTHSRVQCFKTCRKKHWWAYEIGLRAEVDAKALRMGSIGHAGLDAIKRCGSVEQAADVVHAAYATCPDNKDVYEWAIERETVECLLRGYHWRWQDSRLEIVASEQEFHLPLRNQATGYPSRLWDLAGKIDGVVRLEDRRLAVQEHKFLGEPIGQESDYWRRLQIDPQVTIYTYAARESGYDTSTVLFDVVRKPTIRPEAVPICDGEGLKIVLDADGERVLTKQGKPRQTGSTADSYVVQTRPMTPDEWAGKLLADIRKRPDFYFSRHEIARLDSDIADCLEELWDVQETMRDAQLRNRWYKTVGRDSCPWCPYFGLCTSRYDPKDNGVPEGFVKLENVHPELEEYREHSCPH